MKVGKFLALCVVIEISRLPIDKGQVIHIMGCDKFHTIMQCSLY